MLFSRRTPYALAAFTVLLALFFAVSDLPAMRWLFVGLAALIIVMARVLDRLDDRTAQS